MPDPAPNGLRWRAVSAIDHPADDALHLWRIDLRKGDAATDAQALASLSARQQARHARLRLPIHRRRYLRAQAGCRAVLARYLGIEAAAIAFRYGSAGKPELAFGDGSLSFNLTGTGDLAVLAVGSHLPVGVDCEWVRPRPGLHAIARRMFPPQTAARLAGLPAAEQPLAFCLHWTSLEARVKADGRGLARHREADLPGLSVAHALVAGGTTDGCVCAVARQRLPGPERWQGFLLASD